MNYSPYRYRITYDKTAPPRWPERAYRETSDRLLSKTIVQIQQSGGIIQSVTRISTLDDIKD